MKSNSVNSPMSCTALSELFLTCRWVSPISHTSKRVLLFAGDPNDTRSFLPSNSQAQKYSKSSTPRAGRLSTPAHSPPRADNAVPHGSAQHAARQNGWIFGETSSTTSGLPRFVKVAFIEVSLSEYPPQRSRHALRFAQTCESYERAQRKSEHTHEYAFCL